MSGELAQLGTAVYTEPGALSGLGPWAWLLLPASWRGIPFAVRGSRIQAGRRVAVHQYPYRDDVWVEDLGAGMRSIQFQGFLIGDDVFIQRGLLMAACNVPGTGLLIHPSLGIVNATNVQFSAGESADRGRVVELDMTFIEAGSDLPLFPGISPSTQANTGDMAGTLDLANAASLSAVLG